MKYVLQLQFDFTSVARLLSENPDMKQILATGVIFVALIFGSLAAGLDTARIDELTGLKGKMNEKEGVYKVTFPRDGAMVMGDTVLFEDEVNAAMSAALDNGLDVTALHNHFFFDQPKVFFMHIEGEGTVEKLASAVKKVYDTTKAIRGPDPKPAESFSVVGQPSLPEKNSINAAPLNEIFGTQGESD